jgi:hypothetical protein
VGSREMTFWVIDWLQKKSPTNVHAKKYQP